MSSQKGKRSLRKSGITHMPKLEENLADLQFDVRCSYLEIYNEVIIDLLDPS